MPSPKRVFDIYPAIDLRHGQVVRLIEGNPDSQTTYSQDPAFIAQKWCQNGAKWLHVVNLDGAFGEQSHHNTAALSAILDAARDYNVKVQFGGGLRSKLDVALVLERGVDRVVLGTLAAAEPEQVGDLISQFGSDHIAVGIDARHTEVYTHGWTLGSGLHPIDFAIQLQGLGLRWLIYTDINRDGMETGVNLLATQRLAEKTKINIIASGGVRALQDIHSALTGGLAGIIIGKALYENRFTLVDALQAVQTD
ncbi:MAG: 1-(5-phosphoribosyl)-5-[(5-phosphoribosylamino)methylideneamino]imidazole-4-carboxamide isomerase [Anaerolineales bacterium]